jgi:AcrR family transcriptional regulator
MPNPASLRGGSKEIAELSKSELTRQRILDAAAKVFAQRGYGHTRLSDVARESDSHAGGIYYYFASREALVEEVLKVCTMRAVHDLTTELDGLPESATTGDKLFAATRSQLAGIMGQDFYNIAYNRIYPQVPEDVRTRHQPLLRRYFEIWRQIIRQGQMSGEIRPDIDPAVLRLTISGSIQWAAEWASTSHGSADRLARQMMDIFFNGMLTRAGESSG